MKLIAETAFHHDGDFNFMMNLVNRICSSPADIIKIHLLVNLDKYMLNTHPAYGFLTERLFCVDQWKEILGATQGTNLDLMALINDTAAAELVASYQPKMVELHSVALNNKSLLDAVKQNFSESTKLVLGVGGSSLYEIENAVSQFDPSRIVLMFGFQNYPTRYQDVNFKKIRRIMAAFPEFEYGYADHTAWNEDNNTLITLLGAAQGMHYIEKHVTTNFGEERTDYSAAINFDMLDSLKKGMDILAACNGDGKLALNLAEQKYCVPGAMKQAGILAQNVKKGEVLTWDVLKFLRAGGTSDLTQIDIWNSIGQKFTTDLAENTVLCSAHLEMEAK